MPCLPPTPAPKPPPSDLLAQRAIVAAKAQTNAGLIVLSNPETSDEHYEWSAVPASKETHDGSSSSNQSTYIVCYCKPDSNGFRWETHLSTGETFFVNDNATLSQKYRVTMSTPIPTQAPTADPTAEAAASNGSSSSSEQDSVTAFYRAISTKQYSVAYNLESDSMKSATSFNQFVAGYSTTQNVDADTTERNDGSNTVDVVLHATDLKNGQLVNTTYTGYWVLESDGSGGWKLDEGKFVH